MGRMTFLAGVSADRDTTVIEMHEDGKPLAHMFVDAATLEGLIRQLGQCRAAMNETVADEIDPGARIETLPSPGWRIPDTHSGPSGTVLMALRHPGLGWLGFLLEEARAREIGAALTNTPPTP